MKPITIIGVNYLREEGKQLYEIFDLQKEVMAVELIKPTDYSGKVLAYHTDSGLFLSVNTLSDASNVYSPYGFESYDRSTLVNPAKVKGLKEHKRGTKVIFDNDTYVIVRKKLY
ncbi:LytTR family transcriptional regulator DNA-binding domain-containing protein [Paenibacillus provencensis]|uniref:LytTR family transcriptional regulator DNA-binding domain-containing protein n=1 Tax=Paenibacillus provencensis TaxID=441151 RepID=A0ABW3PMT2_9BACL